MRKFGIKGIKGTEVKEGSFDLEEVKINGNVCGEYSEVTISQTFKNNSEDYIEGIYSFPLPDSAIISGFESTIGGRHLRAIVEDKSKTSKIYEDAFKRGESTLLLEEIMPHSFQISMGKIIPGETVKIKLSYIDEMEYSHGTFKLTIPCIENPTKFNEIAAEGYGEKDYVFNLNLVIESLCKINIKSPTNSIHVEDGGNNLYKVNIADESYMKDDFILLLKEEEHLETSGMIYEYKDKADKTDKSIVYLRIVPEIDIPEEKEANNYIFLIDTSETMEGVKFQEEKNAVLLCLRNLSEGDTFDIVAMGDSLKYFSDEWSIPFNNDNLKKATKWIKELQISEDALLYDALKYSLSGRPSDNNIILLFTDDMVENEEELLKYAEDNLGNNRIFTFGIDISVNSYFIRKLAELAYGKPEYIYPGERIEEQVLRQFTRIENPEVDDIKIDLGKMNVVSTYPRTIEYMYDREPFTIFAECIGEAEGEITLRGMTDGKEYVRKINLDSFELEENANLIQKIWCKKRIQSLEEKIPSQRGEAQNDMKKAVIDISRKYGIISPETSFAMLEVREEPVLGIMLKNIIPVKVHERTLSFLTVEDLKEEAQSESSMFFYRPFKSDDEYICGDEDYIKYSRNELLRVLAENQFADGAFVDSLDTDCEDRIETTAMAVLAFTAGDENIYVYANQIGKAVDFLLNSLEIYQNVISEKVYLLTVLSLNTAIDSDVLKNKTIQKIKVKMEYISKMLKSIHSHYSDQIEMYGNMEMLSENVDRFFNTFEGGKDVTKLNIDDERKSVFNFAKLAVIKIQ